MSFSPIFPLLQVIVFGLIAVGIAFALYRRDERVGPRSLVLAVLRAVAVAGIFMLLLNPILSRPEDQPTGKPPLMVLVDTSHSMAVKDVGTGSRFDAAKRQVFDNQPLLRALSRKYTPIFFRLDSDATRQDPTALDKLENPDGTRTCIGEGIAHALSAAGDSRMGGILLLSDGRNNGDLSPADIAKQAKMRKFPVFTVCLGQKSNTKDVGVAVRRSQVYAAPDQEVTIDADITCSGYGSAQAQVQLLRDGKLMANRTVGISDSAHSNVSFPVKESQKGLYRYSIVVQKLPGEVIASNNRASALVNVLKANTRVLVLEGRPTWDAKFLIQALHSDPSVQLDAIFKLTDTRFFAVRAAETGETTSASMKMPTSPAELAKYDVIIIGKGFEEFFTDATADSIRTYVTESGGNLILFRGKAEDRSTTLASLEPVTWSDDQVRDFRMKLTADGLTNPAFTFNGEGDSETIVQALPTLISATRVEKEKALSVVLARANGVANAGQPNKEMAVLAYQDFGTGLVVSLIGQGLWRWALLPPELAKYSKCYSDFWTQLIRWLVSRSDFLPGQNVSLKTDHLNYSPGEAVNLMAFVRGKKPDSLAPVSITGPDGQPVKVSLSKAGGKQADFLGVFRPKAPGDYIATLATQTRSGGQITVPFAVFERREEDLNTSADPGLMRQIAMAGGGEELTLDQLNGLPAKLKEAQALLVTKTEPQSAWDRWWVLAIILGILSAEWILRRRMGMV